MDSAAATRRPLLGRVVAELFPGKSPGYFDTASIGLVPAPVAHAVSDCYAALGRGTQGSAQWRAVVERARQVYADEFGVAADEVSFMASTGEAINAIARAVPWRPGDEVVVLADDFPTVVLPWLEVGEAVRVVRVDPLPGDDRLGALLSAIGSKTRVVAVSHVSSFTGTRVDLDILGRACAEVGSVLVCDGAQAAGCIPVRLDAVDFYIATGYKWLLAGFGVAVVVARAASLAGLHPTLRGHGNVAPSRQLHYGHVNLPGVYALDAAAALRRSIGLDVIHDRIARLIGRIHTGTRELGYRAAADLTRTGGIVSLAGVPNVAAATGSLSSVGVVVASRGDYLRISPHFYTSDHEVDELLLALAKLRVRHVAH